MTENSNYFPFLNLSGDVADVQSILDNAQETAGKSNVFNLTPGPKLKYEALWESVNVAGNRKSLKDKQMNFLHFMNSSSKNKFQSNLFSRICIKINDIVHVFKFTY